MDDLTRAEYPGLLPHLQPQQAVQTLNDRVKRINRINLEIAEWLAERRKVEEQYVLALRKLSQHRVPSNHNELGVFQTPWARILGAVDRIAQSHQRLADGIERDVEQPLRASQQSNDMQNMYTISNNLGNVSKELIDSQIKADKLSRKVGNAEKMSVASGKLDSAQQQWDSQAPFVYESLQALDESRCNQLRDVLTQYQTHESDHAEQLQSISAETLALMLDVRTETEIENFVQSITSGKHAPMTRTSTRRRSSVTAQQASETPAPAPLSTASTGLSAPAEDPDTPAKKSIAPSEPEDSFVGDSPAQAEPKVGKLRRLGTLFGGRKRQSVHGGFGQLSPPKSGPAFGRLGSSGKGVSPRASLGNLNDGRLASLTEDPNSPPQVRPKTSNDRAVEGVNGHSSSVAPAIPEITGLSSSKSNGSMGFSDIASPPAGPPPGQSQKDSEGFNVRAPLSDPISEAQREAAGGEDADQLLKLSIQDQPVAEEDPQEKQAALSSVANTLKMGPATKRSNTIRGRRDVRNTIYQPVAALGAAGAADTTLGSLANSNSFESEADLSKSIGPGQSQASTVDNQSIRSGTSLGGLMHAAHPDMHGPGLNSSIIETVSVNFDDSVIKNAVVNGEIAFSYNKPDSSDPKTYETVKINNFGALEKIGPNRIFVQNSSPDQHDQFSLDLSHLDKTQTAFSYRIFAEESDPPSLGSHAPIIVKPAWKPQGDKLGLLLQYQLNPLCKLTAPVTLHNVVFIATYEGKASGAQTKPTGTHLKDKHLVYWRLGDVTLTSDVQKIVCRILGADGSAPAPGRVEARWEVSGPADAKASFSGISVSRLDAKGKGKQVESDPFSDGDQPTQSWAAVPLSSKLVSGKYEGR